MLKLFGAALAMEGFLHESRSVDSVGKFFSFGKLGIETPDEGLTVRADEVELAYCSVEFVIATSEGEDVGVGSFDSIGTVPSESTLGDPSDNR